MAVYKGASQCQKFGHIFGPNKDYIYICILIYPTQYFNSFGNQGNKFFLISHAPFGKKDFENLKLQRLRNGYGAE